MYFLWFGVILMALKFFEVSTFATWAWWIVLSPFALAVVWWTWADWTGYTKKKVIEKENARKQARIEKSRVALGIKKRR